MSASLAYSQAKQALADLIAQHEIALAQAKARVAQARAQVERLVSLGRCTDDCDSEHAEAPVTPRPAAARVNAESPAYPHLDAKLLQDDSIPICWRIGLMLAKNPVLDYQGTADLIWPGDSEDKHKAKNRVNAQLTRLKSLSVIKTLGSNRYEVDRARLAELSGLPVPEEAQP